MFLVIKNALIIDILANFRAYVIRLVFILSTSLLQSKMRYNIIQQ